MSDAKPSKEALIIQLAGQGVSQRGISAQFGVGLHRVSHALRGFKATGIIPEPDYLRGRPGTCHTLD
jgi:transposase